MIGKTVGKISKQRSLIFAGFLLYGLLIGVFSYWADGRMETFRMILNLPGVEISMRIYNYYLMPYWVSTLEPVGYEYIDCVDGLTGEIIGQEKVPLYSLPIEEEYDLYIPVSVLSWGLIGLGVQLALSMKKIEREKSIKVYKLGLVVSAIAIILVLVSAVVINLKITEVLLDQTYSVKGLSWKNIEFWSHVIWGELAGQINSDKPVDVYLNYRGGSYAEFFTWGAEGITQARFNGINTGDERNTLNIYNPGLLPASVHAQIMLTTKPYEGLGGALLFFSLILLLVGLLNLWYGYRLKKKMEG